MNKNELLELRNKAVKAMENLVEERSESMDSDTLGVIKDFKSEIEGYDNKLEAIAEIRSIALNNTKTVEVKEMDKKVELREAFNQYVRGEISAKEYRAMGTGATKGGETIPDELSTNMLEKVKEYGVIYGDVKKISTSETGQLSFPVYDDTLNQGVWTAEAGSIADADAATSVITMDAYKVATSIVVSSELLEDSMFDIESYLVDSLGKRLSRTIENALLHGDGIGKPTGLLQEPTCKVHDTVNVGSVDSDDFLTAIFTLQPEARKGAKVYVSDDLLKDMISWTDSTGRPLLQTANEATQAKGIAAYIHGYPVIVNYELSDVNTGNTPAFIGNPMSYTVRNVRDIVIARSEDTNFDTDEIKFRATMRLDGKTITANDSFVKIKVS